MQSIHFVLGIKAVQCTSQCCEKVENLCIKSATSPIDGRRDGRDGVELGLGLAASAADDLVAVILEQEARLGGPPPQSPFALNSRVRTV